MRIDLYIDLYTRVVFTNMNSRTYFRKICLLLKRKTEGGLNIYITGKLYPEVCQPACRKMSTDLKPTAPPECLLRPMNFPRKTLMGPGPSNAPPRILNASALPLLGHLHPEFIQVNRSACSWHTALKQCINVNTTSFYSTDVSVVRKVCVKWDITLDKRGIQYFLP